MKIFSLDAGRSVVSAFMAQLRDPQYQTNRTLFRRNLTRIARIEAYELSRTLHFSVVEVPTPLGVKRTELPDEQIVVATVLRAGLAFHEGFLDMFDQCEAAFVAAYREEGTRDEIKIHLDYLASPSLEGKVLVIADPMLATGGSLEAAYKALLTHGTPKRTVFCCAIAAPEGIAHLQRLFPSDDVELYVAAVDDALNDAAYIVPGLGDAGDLSFGEKI